MTATKAKEKPWKPGRPTQQQAMRTWAQAGAERAQAVVDERRIEAAEQEREYDHLSPAVDERLEAVQDRYEASLGWGRD